MRPTDIFDTARYNNYCDAANNTSLRGCDVFISLYNLVSQQMRLCCRYLTFLYKSRTSLVASCNGEVTRMGERPYSMLNLNENKMSGLAQFISTLMLENNITLKWK